MTFWQLLILAIVQGACELLPTSGAGLEFQEVLIGTKICGLPPSWPELFVGAFGPQRDGEALRALDNEGVRRTHAPAFG